MEFKSAIPVIVSLATCVAPIAHASEATPVYGRPRSVRAKIFDRKTNNNSIFIFESLNYERHIIPKTAIARRLLELREKAIADGMKLKSMEEINALIHESRGDPSNSHT